MKLAVIIQCAGSKRDYAGKLIAPNGNKIIFVADPERIKNRTKGVCYFHPDDLIPGKESSWRDYLFEYNQHQENELGLLKAGELYKPPIYQDLIDVFGWENMFILSAGWGLVRSEFLLPDYNITFSNLGESGTRRTDNMLFRDFNQLESQVNNFSEIHFFGTPSYLPLLYKMTSKNSNKFVIHYSARYLKQKPDYKYSLYERTFINWHYSCAKEFIDNIQKRDN